MILEIKDGMKAFIPQKEEGAFDSSPYRITASLDMVGDITLTGNLIVQQSQWVYLRGPVTSSAALINGDITASSLLIRKSRGNGGETNPSFGRAEIEGELVIGGIEMMKKIEELEERIKGLERDNEYLMRGNKK
jgi:hypothetical protein